MNNQSTNTFIIQATTETGRCIEKFYKEVILGEFLIAKADLITQFKTHVSSALDWHAEEMMHHEELTLIWQRLVAAVRMETSEETCEKTILDHVRSAAKHILRFPPRHHSTSEVHNLHEFAKNRAWCDFVQAASRLIGDTTYALD